VSRPANILLILSDQQRADTLGFVGRTPCRTPHLDRLAAEGTAFDRAITPSPICLPARSAIFTGRYPHQTGMMDNDDVLAVEPTLLARLREAGYALDYAGKWHLGEEVMPQWLDRFAGEDPQEYAGWCTDQGLPDGWPLNDSATRTERTPHMSIPATAVNPIPPEKTNDAWIADLAIDLLRSRDRTRPFFLTCSFNGPHPPFKIPEPYYGMYDPELIAEPANFRPPFDEPRPNRESFYRQLWNDHGEEWSAWRKSVAVYWGFVSLIDDQVGRLLNALDDERLSDDTLVIFASDHGELLGQHGLWHKFHAYEEALRVPLIVRLPGRVAAGVRSRAGTSLIDIPATMLALSGLDVPPELGGVDLRPALAGDADWETDRLLYSEHKPLGAWHGAVDWRMVTDNRLKYTWNRTAEDELYDLSADPYEMANRIDDADLADQRRRLRAALDTWMRDTDDPLRADFREETGEVTQGRTGN